MSQWSRVYKWLPGNGYNYLLVYNIKLPAIFSYSSNAIISIYTVIFLGNAIQGMVTIPVSMYQTVVSSLNQMQGQGEGGATPIQIAMAPNTELPDAIQVCTVPFSLPPPSCLPPSLRCRDREKEELHKFKLPWHQILNLCFPYRFLLKYAVH